MKIEKINSTNYANIYCLYTDAGKPIGTKEVTIAGRNIGTEYYSLGSMSRKQIKALFIQASKKSA